MEEKKQYKEEGMFTIEHENFPKIARLDKPLVITEKIDGTNAQIYITEDMNILAGSRNCWLYPGKNDNFGFAKWVQDNREELKGLGSGRHYGEWWGQGIQRKYGMDKKVFSLFNTHKWIDDDVRPKCCDVIPVLKTVETFNSLEIFAVAEALKLHGSEASLKYNIQYNNPEGIVVFHTAANICFKIPYEETHKYEKKVKNRKKSGDRRQAQTAFSHEDKRSD